MFVEQILYPVETLGPGKRLCIWLAGCTRQCPGCSNPELWSTDGLEGVPVSALKAVITQICSENIVDGFTISGGDPMEQADELASLLEDLSKINRDILIFSGYTCEEILKDKAKRRALSYAAVLVDGPYVQEKNEGLVLRGSSNQQIYLFIKEYNDLYADYLCQRQGVIQNFHFSDYTVSIGIHNKDFNREFEKRLKKYNIRRK